MFSDEFRQRLKLGKYTRWAVDLTEDQLQVILWMIGEYGCRASSVLRLLKSHRDEAGWHDVRFARARLALETLFRSYGGERLILEQAIQRFGTMLQEVRDAAQTAIKPMESVVERWPLSWQGQAVGWLTDLVFDDHGACGCEGTWIADDAVAGAEFVSALRKTPHGGLEGTLGGVACWFCVADEAAGRIKVLFWPELREV